MALWVANFFASRVGLSLCAAVSGNHSIVNCDHSTVIYNPSNETMQHLRASFGDKVELRALAVARDAHGQAVLLHLDAGLDAALSNNSWPHSTVATEGRWPYTPVYSNCLWERVAATSQAVVTHDSEHKPLAIELPGGSTRWAGTLPQGRCTGGSSSYSPTEASVEILTLSAQGPYSATLCSNDLWDRETGQCQPYMVVEIA